MYRDDREAMVQRLEALTKVEQQNEALKRELMQLRRDASMRATTDDPYLNLESLGPAERQVLSAHDLEPFPVWAVGLLHLVTFGLFSIVFFGLQQGRLPRARHDDPDPSSAIGFLFVPFYNIYWLFFNSLRLCERITFQYRLRERPEQAPRNLTLAASIGSLLSGFAWPLSLLSVMVLWPIVACLMQHRINRLVELGPLQAQPALPPPQQPLLPAG